MGGPDPLDGLSAYRCDRGAPHWHIVSYGLTELYAKETDDPAQSGWGFELTMRVARRPDEAAPPVWALSFLQNLARYVMTSGNAFAPNHHIDLNGPIALERPMALCAALFALDPELASIESPNGRLAFLQVVGVTKDEYEAAEGWNAKAFLEILGQRIPNLVTDLDRMSILSDPATAAAVQRRGDAEGSSSTCSFVTLCRITASRDAVTATIGATAAPKLLLALRRRIPQGRSFALLADDGALHLRPSARASWSASEGEATLDVSPALAAEMAATVGPRAGRYTFASLSGFTLVIERSQIRDPAGNVVQVVG